MLEFNGAFLGAGVDDHQAAVAVPSIRVLAAGRGGDGRANSGPGSSDLQNTLLSLGSPEQTVGDFFFKWISPANSARRRSEHDGLFP
jgi:hypothetical protein